MMETYKGEDFEKFMVHYYKSLNYLDFIAYFCAAQHCNERPLWVFHSLSNGLILFFEQKSGDTR